MTDNTHDPPGTAPPPLSDDEVLMARQARPRAAVEQLTTERARLTASPGYRLLAVALTNQLGPTDPLELVREMASGRYRWRRNPDGTPHTDAAGAFTPDHMSFRTIAVELERLTGEVVTYETLRRWWGKVWGTSIPDGPARQAAEEAGARLRDRTRAVHGIPPAV